MATTFPASPTIGQQFSNGSNTYEWTGVAWAVVAATDTTIDVITGTPLQVIVTSPTPNERQLALPQNIHSGASPTFANVEVTETFLSPMYREQVVSLSAFGGILDVDLSLGSLFAVTLDVDITTVNFLSVPTAGETVGITIEFTGNGTNQSVIWPVSVKWPSAVAPSITTAAGKVDLIVLSTRDGGVSWNGIVAGQNL